MGEVEPVSARIRRVGAQVRAEHHTAGVVRTLPGAINQLDCACGVTLTNGPGWSLDEHLRMHRAEVKYEALLAVAHPEMPLVRRSMRSRGATAIDALLGGHGDVAADALVFAGDDERDRLRDAALALLDLLDVTWNADLADIREAVPAAASHRRPGGTREPVA